MKKLLGLLFALALSLFSAAFATAGIPEAYVGDWCGSAGDIALSFSVGADGTGTYTFEQGGYRERYGFTLSVDSDAFAVRIPEDNELGIVSCEGTYAYADGVLTLSVKTAMAGGRMFEYAVPCTRAVAAGGVPEEYVGKWAGTSGDISLVFEIGADSRARFTFRQGSYVGSGDVALSVADETFDVEVAADDRATRSIGGTYSYADGVLTLNVENVFRNGKVFRYTVHCERVEAARDDAGAFPAECEVYGQPYVYTGYRIEAGEDGNLLLRVRGNGIALPKGPDGKSASTLSAIVSFGGDEVSLQVDSVTLLATGPISELTTKPIEHELVFKLNTPTGLERIALLNGETGEVVASFRVADEPQL